MPGLIPTTTCKLCWTTTENGSSRIRMARPIETRALDQACLTRRRIAR
jgi:hypothetical protein